MLEYLRLLRPLTEEVRQPLGLVVVHDGHAERVERHQAQHSPVEGVRLHHAADGDAQKSLLAAEVRHWPPFGAPDTGPGHGDALGGTQRMLGVELSNFACQCAEHPLTHGGDVAVLFLPWLPVVSRIHPSSFDGGGSLQNCRQWRVSRENCGKESQNLLALCLPSCCFFLFVFVCFLMVAC